MYINALSRFTNIHDMPMWKMLAGRTASSSSTKDPSEIPYIPPEAEPMRHELATLCIHRL